jgi:hypothetical protein
VPRAARGRWRRLLRGNRQRVNIVDPVTATNKAKVDANGKLSVGDGSGPLMVDGSVTATQTSPTAFLHFDAFGLDGSRGCFNFAAPPAGKAMVLKEIEVDVFADPSPGDAQTVEVFNGPNCTNLIADVNPPGIGVTDLPFDPGVGVAAGSELSVLASGSVQAEAYAFGYAVSASAVPKSSTSGTAQLPQQ